MPRDTGTWSGKACSLLLCLSLWLAPDDMALAQCAKLDGDVIELGSSLVSRKQTIPAGTITYQRRNVTYDGAAFQKLREFIAQDVTDFDLDRLKAMVAEDETDERAELIHEWDETLYFDREQWRLVRRQVAAPHLARLAEAIKDKPGATIANQVQTEDVAYRDGVLKVLTGGELLRTTRSNGITVYVNLSDFDMSLGPWEMMLKEGAIPGQTIAAKRVKDVVRLTFSTGDIGAHYDFSPRLGYAATRAWTYRDADVQTESIYRYGKPRDPIPKPVFVLEANHSPDSTDVRTVFTFITSWTDEVCESDLELKLPEEYVSRNELPSAATDDE